MSFLYVFITSIFLSLNIQSEIPYSTIEKAFVSNDASSIIGLGKDKILLNVLGKEGAYSASQANLVLKDFFTFAIGNYESKQESFRVTIHFKKINSDFKMESLTIEKT
jgi:hypothetical protein